ncbi:MAG: hypothetical protein ACR2LE_02305 [Nocardioidaceae bacterium]
MTSTLKLALFGAAAGAAGTTALNAVTYVDMALRGRPASSTPEETVKTLSERTGVPVPGEGDEQQNRISGLGPLTGLLAGVGVGALLGLTRAAGWRPGVSTATGAATVAALIGTNGPMTVLGVTDPRSWPASSWVADIVPHVAYAGVTVAVLDRLDQS